MKVFTVSQIRAIDAGTIELEPIPSIDLMERAANACATWIKKNSPEKAPIIVFAGPGNNGGDGLAIVRLLKSNGFNVTVYCINSGNTLSADCRQNLDRLQVIKGLQINFLNEQDALPELPSGQIIIDAIFGSGLNRPASGLEARIIKHINLHKREVISIDLPSGLFADDNTANDPECIVKARHTLSFQFPKPAFFFASNSCFTGTWHILDIGLHPEVIKKTESNLRYLQQEDLYGLLRPRPRFAHKGSFGHALLIAGSKGMMGAAVLSARACLRSGTGLATLHVPAGMDNLIHSACPEALVSCDPDPACFSLLPATDRFTAIGAGPGLGMRKESLRALESLLNKCKVPLVLDADALNIIAEHDHLLKMIPAGTIITPHPGEFDRLFGKSENDFLRWKLQIEKSGNHGIYILLKGAYSCLTTPDGSSWFNSTGNPGMATGGSGDVLTGLITGLLASHHSPFHAALLGMWLHGKAGDIAAAKTGQDALIAGDITDKLGYAFQILRDQNSTPPAYDQALIPVSIRSGLSPQE